MQKPTILKFGGTSMGDEHTWHRVLNIISKYEKPFVIVSATAKTTRQLLTAAEKALANIDQAHQLTEKIQQRHQSLVDNFANRYSSQISSATNVSQQWIDKKTNKLKAYLDEVHERQELTDRLKDSIAAIGEQLSSYLLAQCGNIYGLSTTWVDATEIIRTNSNFTQAVPDTTFINQNSAPLLNGLDNQIPIMGGYYGKDGNGNTTTLGFEGSDYTASLMGAALSAKTIEIWTDVNGIYTCDPRLVPEAKPIAQLSFQEATELAYFGTKVLHPSTMQPASRMNIPILVKNIFDPEQAGTLISDRNTKNGMAKAMTFKKRCRIITVTSSHTVMGYKFLAGVFDILQWHHLGVEMVMTTEASVSIAIEADIDIDQAIEQLSAFGSVDVKNELGIISLIGCAKENATTMIIDILSDIINPSALELISFNKLKGNVNIVLEYEVVIPAVRTIHKQVFS